MLKTLGVKRVAAWCEVSDAAVWQWLSRATDQAPFPPKHMPAVLRGAKAEGVEFDAAILWPAMAALR